MKVLRTAPRRPKNHEKPVIIAARDRGGVTAPRGSV